MSFIEIHNSLKKYLPEVEASLLVAGLPRLVGNFMRESTYNVFKSLIEFVIFDPRFDGNAKLILKELSVLWKLF